MPDTISFDFLHPTQIAIDAGPEGLVAVRLLEWARAARPRGLIHVARSETRAQRLVCALRGLAPQLEVVMLPPWDCLPYDRVGPSRETMGRRIAALRRLTGAILEATGRSGSDAGFDARGSEIIAQVETAIELSDGNDDAMVSSTIEDRVWLVQCKREKSITPKKLTGYLENITEDERGLYGIIFAAACDFSKTAQDVFRTKVAALGFAEAYLWGKGEIEDMLFQPKNDHLLFAYFGVSLQLRRRSLKTQVRSRLATKRKALRCLQRDYLSSSAMRQMIVILISTLARKSHA